MERLEHPPHALLRAQPHKQWAQEKRALNVALASEKLFVRPTSQASFRNAVFRFLARTPTLLVSLQADDVAGEAHQANMPGADRGYPNWRRRMNASLEALTGSRGPLAHAAAAMTVERRGLRKQEADDAEKCQIS